jgi:hypothetical protein
VVRICRLVDGTPLGIELAAAWLKVLTADQVAAELERSLDILTARHQNMPARHRSMRAVCESSWQLLAQPLRDVQFIATRREAVRDESVLFSPRRPTVMRLMILEDKKLRSTLRASAGIVSIGSNPECHASARSAGRRHQGRFAPRRGLVAEIVDASVPTFSTAIQKGSAVVPCDETDAVAIRLWIRQNPRSAANGWSRGREVVDRRCHVTVAKKFDSPVTVSEHLSR